MIMILLFCPLLFWIIEELGFWTNVGVIWNLKKKRRWLPIHDLASSFGPNESKSLLFFHAFSRCDTVSRFRGKGKKSFLIHGRFSPKSQKHFVNWASSLLPSIKMTIRKFVVVLYDKSSSFSDVNSAREELFTKTNNQFGHLPPTSASLYQHILRAFYQACFVWGQALIPNPILPSPEQ